MKENTEFSIERIIGIHRFSTPEIIGMGGKIKTCLSDFIVREILPNGKIIYNGSEIGKEILYLSETDVKLCLNMKKAIDLCEEGERLTGYGESSDDKFYLPIQEDLVFKPFAGYLKSKDIVAAKIFTLAKNNPSKGLPASTSFGLIYDAQTLVPLAVLDANQQIPNPVT